MQSSVETVVCVCIILEDDRGRTLNTTDSVQAAKATAPGLDPEVCLLTLEHLKRWCVHPYSKLPPQPSRVSIQCREPAGVVHRSASVDAIEWRATTRRVRVVFASRLHPEPPDCCRGTRRPPTLRTRRRCRGRAKETGNAVSIEFTEEVTREFEHVRVKIGDTLIEFQKFNTNDGDEKPATSRPIA